uniref:Uncharacterized protein n=1 Tax=Lygus hesperus TaxID=30085 RepID=A0A146L211_LYGHE
MATSHELFAGTAKCTDSKPPGYAGHIPCYTQPEACMQNEHVDVLSLTSTLNNETEERAHHATGKSYVNLTLTDLNDPRRNYAKSVMTLAVHGGGIDPTIDRGQAGSGARGGHRSGKYARAPQMLRPKSDASVALTVEGDMLQRTRHGVTALEQKLNTRKDQRRMAYA